MKVLYIIHDFLPKHQAGAEIYTYLLAKELSKKHEVCLFFTEINPLSKSYTIQKRSVNELQCIEVFRPPTADLTEAPYNDEKMEGIFTNILTDYKPDIIHIQHLLFHSLRYPSIARRFNIPVLFTLHDYWLTCPRWGQRIQKDMSICHTVDLQRCADCCHEKSSKLNILSLSSLYHFWKTRLGSTNTPQQRLDSLQKRKEQVLAITTDVNLFISPSSFLRTECIHLGIPEKKILFSDNGINTNGYVKRKQKNSACLRFAFIGTISEHKGVHVLIEAFNTIPAEKAELNIYGDLSWFPEYSTRLKKTATSSAISFKGAIPNSSVAETLSTIDILVVPSIWFENSPLTIHEAFMAGVPVITSNIGGMADLVTDHKSGLLFEVNNPESLAKVIGKLINSDTLVNQLRRGIPAVKSIENNGMEIEEMYQQFLNKDYKSKIDL